MSIESRPMNRDMESSAVKMMIGNGVGIVNLYGSDRFESKQKPKQKQHRFYGDFVNTIMLAVGTPFMVYKLYTERNTENFDAVVMVSAMALSTIFQGLAWKYDSLFFSRMGFLGNCFAGSYMELKEWPLKGVCSITYRFQIGIFTLCLANISLSVREKAIRLITIFVLGSYVSLKSPYSVYTEDALPHLGGAVAVTLCLLFLVHNSASIRNNLDGGRIVAAASNGIFNIQIQNDEFLAQSARMILAAIYTHQAYQVFNPMLFGSATPEQILEGFIQLTKFSIIATIGSVATGIFKTNIDQKEQLELMVRERTKEIHSKNIELRRINIAFEACETPIAITDASRTVVWTNQAFEALAKITRDVQRLTSACDNDSELSDDVVAGDTALVVSSVDRQLTDAIALDGHSNETKLRGAFDFSSPRQDEIEIQNNQEKLRSTKSQYRVEVTPFSDFDDPVDNTLSFNDGRATTDSGQTMAPRGFLPGNSNNPKKRKHTLDSTDIRQTNNCKKLFLVAFNDITADRAREDAEQKAREEALLSKAMKESMVTLTHELRTPLQGIMGITSLMLDSHNDSKQLITNASFVKDDAESLGLIMASSSLLLNLINNLLDVKKASANMMDEFLLAPLLASDPIRESIAFCNPLASISNVSISMDCYCDGTVEAFVHANALRLQQVLINMISNAIKYTDQGTNITVSTRPSTVGETMVTLSKAIASCSDWEDPASYMMALDKNDPVLVFSVSDSGPGIAKDQALLLFQRFARLSQQPTRALGSNTVGQPAGTGLGLHLCQVFVMRMRGCIWAENNSNDTGEKGSTFSFCLPLVEEPLSQSSSRRQSLRAMLQAPCLPVSKSGSLGGGHFSSSVDYRKLRVLVVDDVLINRKVLNRMLKKIGIVQVSTVESGMDALTELFPSFGKTNYDLVITDLQMPGMSGTELTEEIVRKQEASEEQEFQKEELMASIPTTRHRLVVVGLTADTSPGMADKCASSGMSDLLFKPITLVEIKEYFEIKVHKLQPGQWRAPAQ